MRRSHLGQIVTLGVALTACAAPASSVPGSTAAPSSSAAASTRVPATVEPTFATPSEVPEPLAWIRLSAAGPPAREDHTWTVDGDGDIAYLFGGRDGSTVYDDTWAYDLAIDTWTKLAPASSPPARFGHEAAWVDGVGLVVFAGQAGSAFFNDLWAYDTERNEWTELPASGAIPTARYGTCADVGPDGRLWITHGFTSEGTRFSDTRAYDFAIGTWTDETPAGGARPVVRCLHGCWWTDAGELTLYAGQTTGVTALDDRWTLRDGTWTRIEASLPPARNLYARARHDGGTLVFGGQALDGTYLGDLWRLADDAPDAMVLEPTGDGPRGRAGAELVLDASRGRALLFGGRTADGTLDETWTLGGL